jgi:hypothetical protein
VTFYGINLNVIPKFGAMHYIHHYIGILYTMQNWPVREALATYMDWIEEVKMKNDTMESLL